ncbi:polysaccharide deacetylase family protein [Larkinella soli]|uniref:polysaccharide deacetylase family protein n=1 Tax=Larkinella soli TaxID=1770527 RepID=UPI000FFB47A7|nr:polysaccharide deacetylase family protein [Larkinella soli]
MSKRLPHLLLTALLLTVGWAMVAHRLRSAAPARHPLKHPGFALSFDDRSVEEWYGLRPIFLRYHGKATFYVTQPDSLKPEEIDQLRQLQLDGNEIGSHGLMHLHANSYAMIHPAKVYMEEEIHPSVKKLEDFGFQIDTFAYPYGANNHWVDRKLEEHFVLMRDIYALRRSFFGIPLNRSITDLDAIYCGPESRKRVEALSIDHESRITKEELTQALKRARARGEIVLFYGHRPITAGEPAGANTVDVALIEHLYKTARELGLRSYTMEEVARRK